MIRYFWSSSSHFEISAIDRYEWWCSELFGKYFLIGFKNVQPSAKCPTEATDKASSNVNAQVWNRPELQIQSVSKLFSYLCIYWFDLLLFEKLLFLVLCQDSLKERNGLSFRHQSTKNYRFDIIWPDLTSPLAQSIYQQWWSSVFCVLS